MHVRLVYSRLKSRNLHKWAGVGREEEEIKTLARGFARDTSLFQQTEVQFPQTNVTNPYHQPPAQVGLSNLSPSMSVNKRSITEPAAIAIKKDRSEEIFCVRGLGILGRSG